MRQQLEINIGFRQRLERLIDAVIDLIVRVTDYVVYKHITLAEFGLFAYAAGRAVWYSIFGVATPVFDYYFSEKVWMLYFISCSALHLGGFFRPTAIYRRLGVIGYAVAWGLLFILALYSKTTAPAPVNYGVWFGISFVVLVRLSKRNDAK